MTSRTTLALSFVVLVATASSASAQLSISWFTIDGGGGTSAGGAFTLSGTIGQPDAGVLTGGTFAVNGGFWAGSNTPRCPADFNNDGSVDPDDLGDYISCFFAGPASCPQADFNADGNTDPADLGDFVNTYFGPPC